MKHGYYRIPRSILKTKSKVFTHKAVETRSDYNGKSFSIYERHQGDSYIEYIDNHRSEFGCIQYILRFKSGDHPFFVIQTHEPLDENDKSKSPYSSLPRLRASMAYNTLGRLKCVNFEELFGHCGAIINPPKSFQIKHETVSFVSLRSMVCTWLLFYTHVALQLIMSLMS